MAQRIEPGGVYPLLVGVLAWPHRGHDNEGGRQSSATRDLVTGERVRVVALRGRSAIVATADGRRWAVPIDFLDAQSAGV